MNITFGVNVSEPNKVTKTVNQQTSYSGNLRDGTSIIRPSFTVQTFDNISRFNYCYITEFARYYYIENISVIRSGLWVIDCRVDVLNTYSQAIKNNYAIVEKQAQSGGNDKYYNDGSYVNTVKTATEIINFSNGFNDDGEYILIVAG